MAEKCATRLVPFFMARLSQYEVTSFVSGVVRGAAFCPTAVFLVSSLVAWREAAALEVRGATVGRRGVRRLFEGRGGWARKRCGTPGCERGAGVTCALCGAALNNIYRYIEL